MAGKIRNYFAGGNTAHGFHSLFYSNLQDLDRLFILKGGPGTGKSSLMKKIGNEWSEKGLYIEFLHCSSDKDSIDGVIIPSLKAAIVDGTAPHIIEPKAPGAIEEYVNLGDAWNSEALALQKETILNLNQQIKEAYEIAYKTFARALEIHDDWENIYIGSMDFVKADQLAAKLTDTFFGKIKLNKTSQVRDRFLGAATPSGPVDFIPNLTEDVARRYFVKGRPGSGKSTMLKKLAAEAQSRGIDVEIYHCGFDPNSLDMLIFRELGIAVFDSTAPHEYFPSRDGDEIVDMYKTVIAPNTDEIFADKIDEIATSYRLKMKEATSCLAKAKSHHDELEAIYTAAMDFTIVDQIHEKIARKFHNLADLQGL